jgi:hypothetical protein
MRELLLIDLAICAAVIMAAAVLMPRSRGNGRSRMPVEERAGSGAELAVGGMSERTVADVPESGPELVERDPGTRWPAAPEQAAESKISGAAATDHGSDGLGTEPDVPRAVAGTVTLSDRVASYYEEADRPVVGYLSARGWTEEQGIPGRVAGADAAPASQQATAEPDTAHSRLAA